MTHPFTQNAFIQAAQRGKNEAWRYLLGAVLILFTFIIPGSLVSVGLLIAYVKSDGNPNTDLLPPADVVGVDSLTLYVFYNLSFLLFLLGTYGVIKGLHGRSLLSLITPAARISWKRIGQGFGVFFMLKVVEIGLSYWLAPGDFTLNFQARSFFIFLGWVALLTPLQITAEELFFRGYLLQGIGSKLGKWMCILLPSLLFTALHGANTEVATQPSAEGVFSILGYYFMVGAFMAWLTVKDKTLELALGLHAANNIATFVLVTSPDSSIPSPAIFSIADTEASFTSLFFTAISLFVFAIIVFKVLRK